MMKNASLIPVVLAAVALGVVGCEKKPPAPSGTGPKDTTHTHDDGTKHDDGHDHDEHGVETSLGKLTASGYEVEAITSGEVKAGNELHVTIKASGGASKIVAVRVWVGLEDAAGATKSKADAEEAGFHAHADIPDPMPAGSKLWAEIENEKNETIKVSFPFRS